MRLALTIWGSGSFLSRSFCEVIGFLIEGFLGTERLLAFRMRRFLRFARRGFLWCRGHFLLWLLSGRGRVLLCGSLVLWVWGGRGGLQSLFCRLSCLGCLGCGLPVFCRGLRLSSFLGCSFPRGLPRRGLLRGRRLSRGL